VDDMKKSTIKKITLAICVLAILIMCSGLATAVLTKSVFSRHNIEVSFVNQDPDPAEPGQFVDLRWKIDNLGVDATQPMEFKLIEKAPISIIAPETGIRNIGSLQSRQRDEDGVILNYKVKINENAIEGTEDLDLEFRELGSNSHIWHKLENFTILIKTKSALLSVEETKTTPNKVRPGEKALFSIKLKNFADFYLKDIRVKIEPDSTKFATVHSTTEKVVRRLAQGEETTISYTLMANPATASQIHDIPLLISYKDISNNDYNITSSLGIEVYDPPNYILNTDSIYSQGSSVALSASVVDLTLSVSNIGKSDINFVTLELKDSDEYKILSKKQAYLGNIDSDDYESGDFKIFVKKTDKEEINLNLEVTYKDSYNSGLSEMKILPLRIYTKSEAVSYGLLNKNGGNTGIIIVIILAIVLYLVYRRYKKKKNNNNNGNNSK